MSNESGQWATDVLILTQTTAQANTRTAIPLTVKASPVTGVPLRKNDGVLEYIVWHSFENQLDWFYLVDGDYQQLAPDDAGVIRSQVFPGLWLAVNEVLNRVVRVLEVLQAGIQSPEHHTFVEQLTEQQTMH